ncbi:hypothetical protein IC582_002157 [Cucumis melo]|uniref:Uncharacterized protein LOC103497602 n=1 Tax=Cucumis melo TaxID=3656 RepID=A0A1S3C6I0_CUCME|nr:uncharacterized protein LOC103497602 [Cucumis melo]
MAVFSRSKRVTDPLDDKAKARLFGTHHFHQLSCVSSGSEHSPHDSPCLSELVHGFLHDHHPHHPSHAPTTSYDSDSDFLDPTPDRENPLDDIISSLNSNIVDSYRDLLLQHICNAIHKFSLLKSNKPVLLRNVMAFLRELGHNAAVCKTKWSSSGTLTSGNHEFIDVVRFNVSGKVQVRYFVELDLVSEFEIARPTAQYSRMLQCLPRVFAGTAEELMRIVRVMCDGARRSLRSRDLSVSPWRKNRYVQNKWFGPYRRTVNPVPEKSFGGAGAMAVATEGVGAAYRCVGFEDVNMNRRLFVRTR